MQIDGYFNANNEPVLRLNFGSTSIELLVDTGFDGSLILPTQIAARLPLKFEGFEEFHSVTGQIFIASSYSIEIVWLGISFFERPRLLMSSNRYLARSTKLHNAHNIA